MPEGGQGELVIGGVGLARYLDAAKDAEKYAPMPTLGWDRAYRSGDLVRFERAGLIFLGRADDQVKVGGRRIELGEVDTALQALPGVTAAAAAVRRTEAGTPLPAPLRCGTKPIRSRSASSSGAWPKTRSRPAVSGSSPVSAPSGVARLAVVAISQATGGCGSWSATRAARNVFPAPASPVISTPPEKRRLCRARSSSCSRATREVALLTTSSDQWDT